MGEALDFAFRNLTQHNAGREAPPRIEAALLREFQASRLAGSRRRVHGQLAALGAAAAILLALGLGVQHRITSRPGSAAQQAANVVPAPTTDASAKGQNPSTSELDEDEYAGKFVPVPYADDPAALEGGGDRASYTSAFRAAIFWLAGHGERRDRESLRGLVGKRRRNTAGNPAGIGCEFKRLFLRIRKNNLEEIRMKASNRVLSIAAMAVLFVMASGSAWAQASEPADQGPPPPPHRGGAMFERMGPGFDGMGFVGFEASLEGKTVTGAPFLGEFFQRRRRKRLRMEIKSSATPRAQWRAIVRAALAAI
jgi:hypothetical protein